MKKENVYLHFVAVGTKLQGIKFLSACNRVCILLFCLLMLNSCWVERSVTITDKKAEYLGNRYKKMKGASKQQILLSMTAPDRIMPDGNEGEILIYEDKTIVTKSDGVAVSTTSSSGTATGQTYGGGYSMIVASGSSTSVGHSSSLTTTREEKNYIHFFINPDGICYDVKCNVGDEWSEEETHQECRRVANKKLLWLLMPPMTIYCGIPVAIWYGCNKNKVKPCK